VVPVYNEEAGICNTLDNIIRLKSTSDISIEIIVVNDGSTDGSEKLISKYDVNLFNRVENQGYGAALKYGIARASNDLVVIMDGDGTYDPIYIEKMMLFADRYDMVVGSRTGPNVAPQGIKSPAKKFLSLLASFLAGKKIPDLNSGLRVLRKRDVLRFHHLLPSGFSFTTTITLCMLCSGMLVKYVTIDYSVREGESKIRPRHAFEFLLLILRVIVYFNPLKVFIPLGLVFFVGGILKFVHDVFQGDISDVAVIGFLGGTIIWGIGLLSDQISKIALKSDSTADLD